MKMVYLDWNVFNLIEKKSVSGKVDGDIDVFSRIEELILEGVIITPYSNAHINDLLRGYEKSKDYVQGHLQTLKRLTNNLCITQYWGHNKVTWHYRDVNEFFNSALDDLSFSHKKFTELIDWEGPESVLMNIQHSLLRMRTLPPNFGEIYKAHPIFGLMFPKSRTERNMLALCEDLFDFSKNAMKDYSIYKSLRSYINQSRAKLTAHKDVFKKVDKSMADTPKQLDFNEAWENYMPKNKTSDNPAFQKITDLYYKTDLSGYKSDERMPNMIDDSIHVYYGSQCDYFVTVDDRCYCKALKIYNELKVPTVILKPEEFVKQMAPL